MHKLLGSSVNSEKLALTIKGILVAILPVILFVAKLQGWDIGEGDLQNFIDVAIYAISAVGSAIGAVMTLFGLFRKIYYKVKGV